jgi:hypothetical protein
MKGEFSLGGAWRRDWRRKVGEYDIYLGGYGYICMYGLGIEKKEGRRERGHWSPSGVFKAENLQN